MVPNQQHTRAPRVRRAHGDVRNSSGTDVMNSCDFQFQNANQKYKNMDRIIEYINTHSSDLKVRDGACACRVPLQRRPCRAYPRRLRVTRHCRTILMSSIRLKPSLPRGQPCLATFSRMPMDHGAVRRTPLIAATHGVPRLVACPRRLDGLLYVTLGAEGDDPRGRCTRQGRRGAVATTTQCAPRGYSCAIRPSMHGPWGAVPLIPNVDFKSCRG